VIPSVVGNVNLGAATTPLTQAAWVTAGAVGKRWAHEDPSKSTVNAARYVSSWFHPGFIGPHE
jgi:hypothetical protein